MCLAVVLIVRALLCVFTFTKKCSPEFNGGCAFLPLLGSHLHVTFLLLQLLSLSPELRLLYGESVRSVLLFSSISHVPPIIPAYYLIFARRGTMPTHTHAHTAEKTTTQTILAKVSARFLPVARELFKLSAGARKRAHREVEKSAPLCASMCVCYTLSLENNESRAQVNSIICT